MRLALFALMLVGCGYNQAEITTFRIRCVDGVIVSCRRECKLEMKDWAISYCEDRKQHPEMYVFQARLGPVPVQLASYSFSAEQIESVKGIDMIKPQYCNETIETIRSNSGESWTRYWCGPCTLEHVPVELASYVSAIHEAIREQPGVIWEFLLEVK